MNTIRTRGDEPAHGLSRRGFIFGLGATLAVVRTPGLLMTVRPTVYNPYDEAFGKAGLKVGETLRIRLPESWETLHNNSISTKDLALMKIQLSHYEFELSDRYRAGSVLTADEAKALNVERSDRIRNRVARYLDRKTPMKEVLTGAERTELYDWVAELDANFQFEARPTVKPKVGTLEAEIKEVARERAESMARERGRESDTKLIAELYAALLEDSGVEAEAAARIEARIEVAMGGLGEL